MRRRPAKLSLFDTVRAWVMAIALALTGWIVGAMLSGDVPTAFVVSLIGMVAGFEFALYAHDLWRGRKDRHG